MNCCANIAVKRRRSCKKLIRRLFRETCVKIYIYIFFLLSVINDSDLKEWSKSYLKKKNEQRKCQETLKNFFKIATFNWKLSQKYLRTFKL